MKEEYFIIYAGGIIRDLYNAGGIIRDLYNAGGIVLRQIIRDLYIALE